MDWKIKQYENFSGEYLRLKIDISSVVVNELGDEMKMSLRNKVVSFEQELFDYLKHVAAEILDEQANPKPKELTPIEKEIAKRVQLPGTTGNTESDDTWVVDTAAAPSNKRAKSGS